MIALSYHCRSPTLRGTKLQSCLPSPFSFRRHGVEIVSSLFVLLEVVEVLLPPSDHVILLHRSQALHQEPIDVADAAEQTKRYFLDSGGTSSGGTTPMAEIPPPASATLRMLFFLHTHSE